MSGLAWWMNSADRPRGDAMRGRLKADRAIGRLITLLLVTAVVSPGMTPPALAGNARPGRETRQLSRSARHRVNAAVNRIAETSTIGTSSTVLVPYQDSGYKYLQIASG